MEWSTKSSIYGCITAMSGKYFGTKIHKQSSTDCYSKWEIACTNQTKKLLIRLGEIE